MLNINNMGKIIKIKGASFSLNAITEASSVTYILGDYGHEGIYYNASTYKIVEGENTTLGIIPIPAGYKKVIISGFTSLTTRSCKLCSNIIEGVAGEVLSVVSSVDVSNSTQATIDIPSTAKSIVFYVKSVSPTTYDDSSATLTFY